MTAEQTSGLFYMFREDFDYGKYLETRSHFDRVQISVESGFKELIASNEALAEAQLAVSNEIIDGLIDIQFSLDSIDRSLQKLEAVVEHGFRELNARIVGLDESVQQLINIAQTPDQNWALEQYSVALDAYTKGLNEEALDYVSRAIDGYGSNSGYRLEHRFYKLRALIRLGDTKNFSAEILDLAAATEDFLAAARYSAHDDPSESARNLGMAGWASYCDGRFDDAKQYYLQSLERNESDSLSRFELSKVLFRLSEKSEGIQQLELALQSNWRFIIRVGGDREFRRYKQEIESLIEHLTALKWSAVNKQVSRIQNLAKPDWPAQLNWPNLFGRTGGWLVAAFMPPSPYKAA